MLLRETNLNSFQLSEEYYINNNKTIKNTWAIKIKITDYQYPGIFWIRARNYFLLYTTAAQENSKDKYYYSQSIRQIWLVQKNNCHTAYLNEYYETILLLFYTIYAFIRK
jgi:hypothetical protein